MHPNDIKMTGTLLVFWCIRYFSSSERRRFGQLNPALEDASIQAGYGQLDASGNLPTSIQLTRRQNISVRDPLVIPWKLHIGDSGTIYHVDCCCLSFPDSSKRVLTLCQFCNNSSLAFEIRGNIFASEQGQRFHLSRIPILPNIQELVSD